MKSECCGRKGSCMTRRQMLAASCASMGFVMTAPTSILWSMGSEQPEAPVPVIPVPRVKVGLIFSHITPEKPGWPYIHYDYESKKKELAAELKAACPNTEFVVGTAMNAAEGESLVKTMEDAHGFINYMVGGGSEVPLVVAHSGKPTLLVDDLYAGTYDLITSYPRLRGTNLRVLPVTASQFADVARAARLFEVIQGVQHAKIVDVVTQDVSKHASQIKDATGIEVLPMTHAELESYYKKADETLAAEWADMWIRGARKVVEPTRAEMIKSGKMHLAISTVMKERAAEAIAIDCLGGFYSGKLTAYPCLSFHQLNNDGYVGACEADLNSAVAMVMIRHLARRSSFISDPVFDSSKGQIIYTHCVAPTKMYGRQGKENPYILRSHAEDNKGAVVQSLLPLGDVVTTIEFNAAEKAMVVHTAKAAENIDDPKACRTKLAAEAKVEKILSNWRWGWHRVTFYGDYRREVKNLATLMGLTIYEEDV